MTFYLHYGWFIYTNFFVCLIAPERATMIKNIKYFFIVLCYVYYNSGMNFFHQINNVFIDLYSFFSMAELCYSIFRNSGMLFKEIYNLILVLDVILENNCKLKQFWFNLLDNLSKFIRNEDLKGKKLCISAILFIFVLFYASFVDCNEEKFVI